MKTSVEEGFGEVAAACRALGLSRSSYYRSGRSSLESRRIRKEGLELSLGKTGVGIAYMVLIGQRFLPDHREESPAAAYALRDYLSEIVVLPASPLIGQTSVKWELSGLDFRILSLIRGDEKLAPDSQVLIEQGDTLLVEG